MPEDYATPPPPPPPPANRPYGQIPPYGSPYSGAPYSGIPYSTSPYSTGPYSGAPGYGGPPPQPRAGGASFRNIPGAIGAVWLLVQLMGVGRRERTGGERKGAGGGGGRRGGIDRTVAMIS